jgi:predicted NBD/HSP70 family sugar kinase
MFLTGNLPARGAAVARGPGTPRLLREINDRAALDLLLEHGSMTRAQLVAATGLSKPTAAQLLERLQAAGLVSSLGTTSGGRGPSAQVYGIDGSAGFVVGVDVAPQQVVAAVADIAGVLLGSVTVAEDMRRSPDPAAAVARAVRRAVRKAGRDLTDVGEVVVASPGVLDVAEDRVKHAEHMAAWARPGVCSALTAAVGVTVRFENDVNVVAVAERAEGAATDVTSFAVLWIGTGLGVAIDLGGALHRGFTGGAGEVGYMPLPGFAEPRPGRHSPNFQALVREQAVLELARRHGIRAGTAGAALDTALDDEGHGAPFLAELADRIATGTAMVVSVLDPEMVVLAGPVAQHGGERLRRLVERRLTPLTPLRPRIALSAVNGNPVIAGALRVGLAELRDQLFTSAGPLRSARSRP